ncbi:hypothetical protein IT575_02900 [bacterium]|nr:hypothetical protein [bacterium]
MKTSLNSRPCDVPDQLGTFEQLMSFVESNRLPPGHVITRIVVDGDEWDEVAESQRASSPLTEIELVEFYSVRTIDLAREGLEDATQLIPALADDLLETAALLRGDDFQDGLGVLYECIELLDWYVNLVTAVDIIFSRNDPEFRLSPTGLEGADSLDPDADFEALSNAESGPELKTFAAIDNLREKLLAMEEAQKNNDLLLLADLIEYEIQPIVKLWASEAPVLLAKVSREGGTA